MIAQFTLDVRGKFLGIEVRVNDLPLVKLKEGGNVPAARINYLIIPGKNEVTLRAFLPASRPAVDPEAFTTLRVSNNGEPIFEYSWSAIPERPELPPDTVGTFDAAEGLGVWRWQTATKLALPIPDPEGLNALLTNVHIAMNNRDLDGLMSLLAHKNADIAQAYDLNAASADSGHREFFAGLFEDMAWAMEPLDLTTSKHVLCAENRIVQTLTFDNKEPIRAAPNTDGAVYSLPILASRFDENWVVVR